MALPLVVALAVPIVAWLATCTTNVPLLTQARVSWATSAVFDGGLGVFSLAVVRLLPTRDPGRWFWRAMTMAGVLLALGNLSAVGGTLHGTLDQAAALGTPLVRALIGIAAVAVVAAMCAYPLGLNTARERLCFWLDMATVMVGAGAFCWYFAGESALVAGNLRDDLLDLASGPVVMLVAAFAVARLMVSGRAPFTLPAGLVGAGAAVSAGVSGTLGPVLMADHHPGWFFAISSCADALLMASAVLQWGGAGRQLAAPRRERERPYSTLPYLSIAAIFGFLVAALNGRDLDLRTWMVLGGAIISTGLVVARQLASFADNRRLLLELDATVGELRTALRERDALAETMRRMAFEDSLTGLANRALFNERLGEALVRAGHGTTDLAVLLLDLDDFKPINDGYGHAAGDAVLKEIAARLCGCVRENDLVARLGGDEFGIVMEGLPPERVPVVVDRIVTAVREPCMINGRPLSVGISVGVAYGRAGEHDAEQLVREADAAMYTTKKWAKKEYRRLTRAV